MHGELIKENKKLKTKIFSGGTIEPEIADDNKLSAVKESADKIIDARSFRRQAARIMNKREPYTLKAIRLIIDELKTLILENKKLRADLKSGGSGEIGKREQKGKIILVTHNFGETDKDTISGWIDSQKESAEPLVAFALGTVNGNITCTAAATSEAVKKYDINIGQITKKLLTEFGGRGGGKLTFAQGSLPDKINEKEFFKSAIDLLP